MDDLIHKIQHGDTILGWEGDERLAVFASPTPIGMVFELLRLEEDGEYRFVVKTEPGDPFDNHIIHWLITHDQRRKPKGWNLDDEVKAHNMKIDADRQAQQTEWIREDLGPRLLHAVRKDNG